MDITAFWFLPGGANAIFRALVLFVCFFYVLVRKKVKLQKHKGIILFAAYILCLVPFSDDVQVSLSVSLKVILPFLLFLIGYYVTDSEAKFKKYIKQFIGVYIIIILNTVVSNYYGLGIDAYTKSQDYVVGGLDGMWNAYTYSLLMLPVLLLYIRKPNAIKLAKIVALVIFVLLLISLKRVAILGVLVGFGCYFAMVPMRAKYVRSSILFAIVLVLASPLYMDLLTSRLETRRDKNDILTMQSYQKESRYMEVFEMANSLADRTQIQETVFGRNVFDSRNAFEGRIGEGRQLHVDYLNIIYTAGLIGFFLYMSLYLNMFQELKQKKLALKSNKKLYEKYRPHLALIYALLVTSLITSFAGQMYQITFRVMIFMTVGAVFGLLNSQLKSATKRLM
jgi:hypothetical protein